MTANMTRLRIREFDKISKDSLKPIQIDRLNFIDQRNRRITGRPIFDWNRINEIRAQNYVGVIQIPGLAIEILPKIDATLEENDSDVVLTRAQGNLLYMLSQTRKIPIRERDLADLNLKKLPLLEALILIFVERILLEIRRGLDREYVYRRENNPYLNGKLLINEHLRRNSAHKERFFTGFDDFVPDTWLNRILKAACRKLLGSSLKIRTQQRLREATLCFAEVADISIHSHHFDRIHFNRNTERFVPLIDFSRLVLFDKSPSPSHGTNHTFSMLFPMEKLFEEFVARFIQKHHERIGLRTHQIHVQAVGKRKWLLRTTDRKDRFQLKPDLILTNDDGKPLVIIDTKWKRLKKDVEDSRNGVSQTDMYQLYAYANRYKSSDNVLLFPEVPGVSKKQYVVVGEDRKVRVEFLDLRNDLQEKKARYKLCDDLKRIIYPPV